MRAIHLHGHLGKEFGTQFRFDVATAAEAVRALNCAFPGRFMEVLKEGHYKIVRGDAEDGLALDIDLLSNFKLGGAPLHIIPVAEGAASGKGTAAIIAGAVIVGAAIFFSGGTLAAPLGGPLGAMAITYGNVMTLGLGVALWGVSTMMAKPDAPRSETADQAKSFMFNGPVNVSEQGNPVPLVYGMVICGSQVISGGMDTEDIGAYESGQPFNDGVA